MEQSGNSDILLVAAGRYLLLVSGCRTGDTCYQLFFIGSQELK